MADLFELSNLSPGDSAAPSTGDLRRRFDFSERFSELALSQDPFFRLVSKLGKKPTDDPKFKFTEKRPSWHKRYAYVIDHGATSALGNSTDATIADLAQGATYYFKMATDYKSEGNIQNIFGTAAASDIEVGDSGTRPEFFIVGSLVRIPCGTAFNVPTDYMIGRVEDVTTSTDDVTLKVTIVKDNSDTATELCSYASANTNLKGASTALAGLRIHDELEFKRCYVIGTAHKEGSGYPETWKDQPYTTGYGLTQIWKTAMVMTNTARATALKYEGNEWARIWKEKLIEHKWDIEQDLLFGSQYEDSTNGINYTQGAIDYCLNNGNIFGLTHASKTVDSFLDDMGSYMDPRYNNSKASIFFCDTYTWNWMHKLGSGSYLHNNLSLGKSGADEGQMYQSDLMIAGKKKMLGLDTTVINTIYGDINLVRNIHLDGSNVKILACGMNYMKYRPLVGNGLNRDTAVYVGVQTLENSGVDRRVDLIQTEAGMEFSMPECHAIWK
tara:strand:- start:1372 stop:2865 length:1494 start_codon:yes stop_codon:yes gene_type:complete